MLTAIKEYTEVDTQVELAIGHGTEFWLYVVDVNENELSNRLTAGGWHNSQSGQLSTGRYEFTYITKGSPRKIQIECKECGWLGKITNCDPLPHHMQPGDKLTLNCY